MSPPERRGTDHVSGVLLLYNRPAFFSDAATITDHIESFGRFSAHRVTKLNTAGGFPRDLAQRSFDAIVLHYSLFASGPNPYLLDEGFLDYLLGSERAYKVAFFQDEHEYCRRRFEFLDAFGVDCVYTCFREQDFASTYGRYTNVSRLVSYMPAYVSPDLVAEALELQRPDSARSIDVGYRTRPTPPTSAAAGSRRSRSPRPSPSEPRARGFASTSAPASRIASTASSGTGSSPTAGASSAPSRGHRASTSRTRCARSTWRCRPAAEPSAWKSSSVGRWDAGTARCSCGRPARHFEAAAMRVCQIMYEGHYSGVLEPGRHFISLKKDLTNFDEVLARFVDPATRSEIAENAFRDLIASGDYGYERFIAGFDQVLADAGIEPNAASSALPAPRGRPPVAVAGRYLQGASLWLMRTHPRAHRIVLWLLQPAAWPLRQLRRLLDRG